MRDNKHVILVVDDSHHFRKTLKKLLQANHYIVEEAGNVNEGVMKYQQASPDAVFVDFMMDGMQAGKQMIETLKQLNNHAPVFLLSNASDSCLKSQEDSQLNFCGIFQKPIDPDHLFSVLRSKLT